MSADHPLVPPATIGMLGGGQLGRYALIAARVMGYRTIVFDPDPNAPAGAVADEHLVAAYGDDDALRTLATRCDVVTTEFENPPAAALVALASTIHVAPSPFAVGIAQDRVAEKRFLTEHGFPVGAHLALTQPGDVDLITPNLVGGGAVVKTARLGSDGKGQRRVVGVDATVQAWSDMDRVPCVVETLLDLDLEISVLVGRTADGAHEVWPVAENVHVDGILDVSTVPADQRSAGWVLVRDQYDDGGISGGTLERPGLKRLMADIDDGLRHDACALAVAVAEALGYVGVLAVEMFVVGGRLLVNELAPRPHNSGHWTLDASATSQYEQQIRAVCGVGLGDASLRFGGVAMVNLLGDVWLGDDGPREPDWAVVLADPNAKLHLYGKTEPRPGRKMGHLTVVGTTPTEARRRALELRTRL